MIKIKLLADQMINHLGKVIARDTILTISEKDYAANYKGRINCAVIVDVQPKGHTTVTPIVRTEVKDKTPSVSLGPKEVNATPTKETVTITPIKTSDVKEDKPIVIPKEDKQEGDTPVIPKEDKQGITKEIPVSKVEKIEDVKTDKDTSNSYPNSKIPNFLRKKKRGK